jgi:hypothetical protein
MSTTEGTNATTGTVTMTKRQLVASDSQLAKLLVKSNVAAEKIRDAALAKVDEVIENGAWRVSFDAEGKPFENVKDYLTFRLAPVATLAALISRPIAQRLLLMETDKGKRVFTVRDVESTTGVSRGLLNEMNQVAKRAARPNDGTDATTPSGEQESDERLSAKRAVKRLDGTSQAVLDAIQNMTREELVSCGSVALHLFGGIAEQFKLMKFGDDIRVDIKAARDAAASAPAA